MMDDQDRYDQPLDEADSVQLNDVLEPYQLEDEPAAPPEDGDYDDESQDPYDYNEGEPYEGEDYSDYHEALDHEGQMHTAIGVLNTASILAGVVVILVLVAMLLSLVSWLRGDILHTITLFQSGIQ